jgi:hypothetical protein
MTIYLCYEYSYKNDIHVVHTYSGKSNSLRVPGGLHLHGYVFATRFTIFPFFSVNPIDHFQLVDRQKHYYCILERNIIRPTQQVEKLVAMPSVVIKESQIFIKVSMVCVWSVGRAHGDTGQALMRTQSGLLLCCGRQ